MRSLIFALFSVLVVLVSCADLRNRQNRACSTCPITCWDLFCYPGLDGCLGCYPYPPTRPTVTDIIISDLVGDSKRENEERQVIACPEIGCLNPCPNGYQLQANGCPSCTCVA